MGQWQEKGNEYVKMGKMHYKEAVDCYTRAIDQKSSDPLHNSICYSNRAHVELLLGNNRRAYNDAQEAIKANPANIKVGLVSWFLKSFLIFYFFCCLCYEIELEALRIFPPSPTRDHLINSPHMHCNVAWLWVWWKNSIKQILAWMGSRTGISLTSLIPSANFRLILEGQKLLWHLDCTQKHQTSVSRAWSLTPKMMSSKR